ncbi:MAG: serine protease [Roseibium sp.]
MAAQNNAVLEERLASLRDFARADVCKAPAQPPTIITPEEDAKSDRVFRPVVVDPETANVPSEVIAPVSSGSKNDGGSTAATSGQPAGGSNQNEGQILADVIRNGTVLILAVDSGIGTGFVVDEHHIITNFHVVDGATELLATSRASGRSFPVELVASVEGNPISGEADLALLKTKEKHNLERLTLVPYPNIMDGVFAAGYPGFVVQTDEDYEKLVAGDPDSAPGVVITPGRINTIQNRSGPAPLLVHSAEISQGNSGGPLVDECGRVVGINTFGRTDKKYAANRTVFYAQPSKTALDAFADAGANIHIVEGYCGTVTIKNVSPNTADQDIVE